MPHHALLAHRTRLEAARTRSRSSSVVHRQRRLDIGYPATRTENGHFSFRLTVAKLNYPEPEPRSAGFPSRQRPRMPAANHQATLAADLRGQDLQCERFLVME